MKSIDKIVDDYLRETYEIGSDEEDVILGMADNWVEIGAEDMQSALESIAHEATDQLLTAMRKHAEETALGQYIVNSENFTIESLFALSDDEWEEKVDLWIYMEDLDRSTLQTLIEDNYNDSINYLSELESQTR